MDRLLRQCGVDIPHQCAMDSISLERERSITIASKVTSISWKKNELNIVDTPAHADFGGEENPTHVAAQQYLSLRAVGAPAVVLSLALQGIFRGFKDTKAPVLCLGIGNLSAVFLFPLLMYYFQLGVTGAAISAVLSQYIGTLLMIWYLNKRAELLPPKMGDLEFGRYIKSGEELSLSCWFLFSCYVLLKPELKECVWLSS